MNINVIIPAYNEEQTIGDVIANCKLQIANCKIIVIDDGSIDRTVPVAREAGAMVLCHPINRGLGAALATGIEAGLRLMNQFLLNLPLEKRGHSLNLPLSKGGPPLDLPLSKGGPPLDLPLSKGEKEGVIVTLDADGQHDPAEIPKLVEPILKGEADVVIGSRFLHTKLRNSTKGTKFRIFRSEAFVISYGLRRIANEVGNWTTWLLFGIRVTDSQSGFRAFSAEAARKLRIRTNTMEVSSEILREIKLHGLRLKEVPITAIYTDYSLSKGQGFWKGLETLRKLIVLKFFR